jgi:hypothetical protein
MRNLIEQSKQKSTTCFTKVDGEYVANYQSVIVTKQIGEKRYCWHIERALEGHFVKHYILCEVSERLKEDRRWKFYLSEEKFEAAIKRIEKQVN